MSGDLFVQPTFTWTFKVLGEPRAWERARAMATGKGVRFFASKEQVDRQNAIRNAALFDRIPRFEAGEPLGLDVVAAWLYPRGWSAKRIDEDLLLRAQRPTYLGAPKVTRPDVDNVVKEIGDAMNLKDDRMPSSGWPDDAQIVSIRSAKVWGPEAATFIRIWTGSSPPPWPLRWW